MAYITNSAVVSDPGGSDTSLALVIGAAVSVGDYIVGSVSWEKGPTLDSVGDSLGNAYTLQANEIADTGDTERAVRTFYGRIVNAGTPTVTAQFSGTTFFRRLMMAAYSGLAASSVEDGTDKQLQHFPGSNIDDARSPAMVTTVAGDTIIGFCNAPNDDGGAIHEGTNFTKRIGSGAVMALEDQVQVAAGSIFAGFDLDVDTQRVFSHICAFKAAVAASGPQCVFMEAGTDATSGTEFYTTITGAGSSDTTAHTGPRALLCDTSSPAVTALARKTGILSDAGRRITVWVRFSSVAPSATASLLLGQTAALANVFAIQIQTTGILRINPVGATIVAGTTVLSANTWYRVSVAYTITNSTTYTIKLFLNGALEATANAGTLTNTVTDGVVFQSPSGAGINYQVRFDDIYIDDGATLDDPRDIRVTAKLPSAVNVNGWDTTIGGQQVNERPLSEANGMEMTTPSATNQNYTLQARGVGDVDLLLSTLIARAAWVWTKTGSAAADAKLMDNGLATAISTTTSAALATLRTTSGNYPSDPAGIGMVASPTVTTFLYECGTLIAYIPPAELVGVFMMS